MTRLMKSRNFSASSAAGSDENGNEVFGGLPSSAANIVQRGRTFRLSVMTVTLPSRAPNLAVRPLITAVLNSSSVIVWQGTVIDDVWRAASACDGAYSRQA